MSWMPAAAHGLNFSMTDRWREGSLNLKSLLCRRNGFLQNLNTAFCYCIFNEKCCLFLDELFGFPPVRDWEHSEWRKGPKSNITRFWHQDRDVPDISVMEQLPRRDVILTSSNSWRWSQMDWEIRLVHSIKTAVILLANITEMLAIQNFSSYVAIKEWAHPGSFLLLSPGRPGAS
jgi:hypothetical protein